MDADELLLAKSDTCHLFSDHTIPILISDFWLPLLIPVLWHVSESFETYFVSIFGCINCICDTCT